MAHLSCRTTSAATPKTTPAPPDDVVERKAYLVGSGIASLFAAAYLIRDARMPGESITVLEELSELDGAFDGSGDAEKGFRWP